MSFGSPYRRSGAGLGTWVLLAGVGLLLGLGVALFFSLPRLTVASPAAGAQFVSSRAPLRLTFSRPMDQASVEAGLQISPAQPGRLRLAGPDAHLHALPGLAAQQHGHH